MALRFQLLNDFLGPFVIDHDDPIDINAISQTIKRSEENDGVVYEIIVDVEFIKAGREYIKKAYELYGGIDAQVNVNIYEMDPNERRWKLYAQGQINYNKYDLSETGVAVAIEQTGFQRRVLNLMDEDVDLETIVTRDDETLPAQTVIDLPMHSKGIRRMFQSSNTFDEFLFIDDPINTGETRFRYFIPTLNPTFCDEIEERYDYSNQVLAASSPTHEKFFQWKIKEAGNYEFSITVLNKFRGTAFPDAEFTLQWKIAYGTEQAGYTTVNVGSADIGQDLGGGGSYDVVSTKTLLHNVDLNIGDEIYFFLEIKIENIDSFGGTLDFRVFWDNGIEPPARLIAFGITALTTAPESSTRAVMIHEAMSRTLQFYTNQEVCFQSDLLGREDIDYAEDGQYSLIAVTNGGNIREAKNPTEVATCVVNEEDGDPRKIFTSFKFLNEFVRSVACTGFGFETNSDGVQVVRLEKLSHFYDKNTRILSLGGVYDPHKRILSDRYYNGVTYGYAGKIDTRNVNGIDEFNTPRKSSIPIVNTKNVLNIQSKMKCSGYQIEAQRRLKYSTEDSNNDDELFAIVVKRDGDYVTSTDFTSKKDEGYASIENVIDAETGYNYDISPARNLINWYEFIASGLTRSFSKVVKFVSGEVNYTMITRKTTESVPVAENGNVDLTGVVPIWDNEEYEITNVQFTRQMLALVKANPYGYIEFFDLLGNRMEGFIKTIDHDANKKQANLVLLKVFR